jgi:hypothetical protein
MLGKSHTRALVVRYILTAAVLALFAPVLAHADTIIENTGGKAGTPSVGSNGPFSLKGSTVFSIGGVGVTGATLAFTTGAYISGSLATGGAMWSSTGSTFTVQQGATTIFTGSFTGNVTWTLDGTCTTGSACTYTLSGNISGSYLGGPTVSGTTAQINITTTDGPYQGGTGTKYIKNLTGTTAIVGAGSQVPEPGTLALMGTGLLSLAGAIKRKMRLG